MMTLQALILSETINYYNPKRGAIIHKLDDVQAQQVADIITREANRVGMAVADLAACICQESRFDPACYNKNLGEHPESFAGTDWGICQISGKYLPDKPGMKGLTEDQMKAKVLDPNYSIALMADTMAGNLAWANKMLPTLTDVDKARVPSAFFLATLAYNRGNTGALQEVAANTIVRHPYNVLDWAKMFHAKLDPPAPPPAGAQPLWVLLLDFIVKIFAAFGSK